MKKMLKIVAMMGAVSAVQLGAFAAEAPAALTTKKDDYLDVMEAAVRAYSDERLAQLADETDRAGVQEHGFPRLAANLGVLVANGRLLDKKALFAQMMTTACRDAAKGKMPRGDAGNDFSVKELVWALVAVEKAGVYPKATMAAWRETLTRIDGRESYARGRLRVGEDRARNWAVFACASEQARLAAGAGGDPSYVETYVADQLRWFDELGMYRDPHSPMVYDLVTRLQFMHVLAEGYDGASRARLENLLDAAAEPTLRMLSAAGEIPFGGRSQQFLHNSTFYAAVCEWYAARSARRGDLVLANRFKRAARRSLDALRPWLARSSVRHVKNRYPPVANGAKRAADVGCESYAYFDKYMITMGSWALGAYQLCEDVPSADVPPEEPFVFATTPDFHQVLLSSGDYSAQFDWSANPDYDATGLGCVQRRGAPGTICLAAPCPAKASYRRECDGPALAIAPVLPAETPLALQKRYATATAAHVEWTVAGLEWNCTLDENGLLSELRGPGEVALALPAFEFDGAEAPDVRCDGRALTISYGGWVCRYEVVGDGQIVRTDAVTSNRNGRYRRYEARGSRSLSVRISIAPSMQNNF